jgi:polyhydroxybutyrate depolymerase
MRSTTITSAQFAIGGRVRTYTVVAPGTPTAAPTLVLVLHGSNQSGAKLRRFTGHAFDELADTHGAVVVYPDAYRGLWNDARATMKSPARSAGIDDVAFLTALISRLEEQYAARSVVAAGYSNGGQMVIRLIHEVPDRLAAAALIGATQPTADNFTVHADIHRALPVLIIHGTKDPLVPYSGGMASLWGLRPRGTGLSAPQTADYYADRNGITAPPTHRTIPHAPDSGPTSVTASDYRQDGHAPVVLYTVTNGGHTVPNPTRKALPILGRTTRDINAADVLWQFAGVPGRTH